MSDFTTLGLSEALVGALAKQEISVPTPIQELALSPLLDGQSAYVRAETGSGKTLTYLLPMMDRFDYESNDIQGLVIAPTHELAIQIQREATLLAQQAGFPMRCLLAIGGTSIKRQLEKIKKKPHLVVGSAGRVLELATMKRFKFNGLRTFVVDEADRMLMGDKAKQTTSLMMKTPIGAQRLFVSATDAPQALEWAEKLAPGFAKIQTEGEPVADTIAHYYFECEDRDKPDLLRQVLRANNPERAIVFMHKTGDAELLNEKLNHYKIPAANLHGTHDKAARKSAMDGFRNGKVSVLIASDVGARGLDIKGVTHVFNYDLPAKSKDYLHRVGRTGRAGKEGFAVSLVGPMEDRYLVTYKKQLGVEFTQLCMMDGKTCVVDRDTDDE